MDRNAAGVASTSLATNPATSTASPGERLDGACVTERSVALGSHCRQRGCVGLQIGAGSCSRSRGRRPEDAERQAADSGAALQREREYMDWLAREDRAAMRDDERDDSWEAFMAERESARSQQRAAQRRKERWQQRGQSPPAGHVDARKQVQDEWEAS